ncbi:MAG TPA: folylpolyglutamate synthase/dihydrofolate synthase family protein [Candidatus Binatia bacterium]|nr:folylpolyglutamate synthase/dihydrofolate synthase family protein [Candidatus Binatia bacterium]
MDTYSETLNTIYNLRGGVIDLRLDRMTQALALFGHPEQKFPSFHIAGTNGKGSTAAMLHRILSQSGYRVGLYTSPHLVSFTERIRVGDEEIPPNEVVALAQEIWDQTRAANVSLTFFEFVTVMAFIHFTRRKVDVGVVEVGLGGRLDATNLVRPAVSLISTISKDHEAYLGSDLLSIAREKGGIIKRGVPVVCGALPTDVAVLLKHIADEHSAPCYFLGRDFTFSLKNEECFDYRGLTWRFNGLEVALRGRHQKRNAALALAGLEIATQDFPVTESALREGLKTVRWPGRFEIIQDHPAIVLDGAHNGEGVGALIEELQRFRGQRRVRLLFASMEDKDWRLMLEYFSGVVDEIILTRVSIERCADPFHLASQLGGNVPYRAIGSAPAALRYAVDGADFDDIILIAGSLYLIGEMRPLVQEFAVGNPA